MDWKLELIAIPVSDVDRAKAFYSEGVGFNIDHDHQVNEELRFVQLTPLGSDARSRSAPASWTCPRAQRRDFRSSSPTLRSPTPT